MSYRILIASDHYPPFIGGAHRQTQLLSQELRKRGHTVAVATVWHPSLPAVEDDSGVPVYRFRQLRTLWERAGTERQQRHQPPFPDPVTTWQLRRLLDNFQPDVVHSYGWYTYSLAAALAGKQTPLLISARDYAYACATRTLVQRGEHPCSGPAPAKCVDCAVHLYGAPKGIIATAGVTLGRKLLERKVTGVHSISTYVQEMVHRDAFEAAAPGEAGSSALIEAIIPSFRENDQDVRYGADPALQPYLAQLPDRPFILFVGALRRVKGVEQLLTAYGTMVDPPPLVLIGTYESDSPRTFGPGVHVLSNFPHRAVMAAWERALFGVIPSLWPEPLGSVVYEGMSRGKALIGTRPGGHTDMIADERTGLLVPQGDVAALAAAMQRLAADEPLRNRLGQAARIQAQQFTAAVNVPRFEQLYAALIDRAAIEHGQQPGRQSRPEIVSS